MLVFPYSFVQQIFIESPVCIKCCPRDNTVNRMMSLFSQSLHSNEPKLITTVCLIRVMGGSKRDAVYSG